MIAPRPTPSIAIANRVKPAPSTAPSTPGSRQGRAVVTAGQYRLAQEEGDESQQFAEAERHQADGASLGSKHRSAVRNRGKGRSNLTRAVLRGERQHAEDADREDGVLEPGKEDRLQGVRRERPELAVASATMTLPPMPVTAAMKRIQ